MQGNALCREGSGRSYLPIALLDGLADGVLVLSQHGLPPTVQTCGVRIPSQHRRVLCHSQAPICVSCGALLRSSVMNVFVLWLGPGTPNQGRLLGHSRSWSLMVAHGRSWSLGLGSGVEQTSESRSGVVSNIVSWTAEGAAKAQR